MIENADEFARLRTSDDPAAYHQAAHDTAPLAVWLDVIARYPDLRFWVAQNKTIPITILEILCRDPDPHVRCMVAVKRSLPEDLQVLLATDPDSAVRAQLTTNARVSARVLNMLSHDEEAFVRERAAERMRSPAQPGRSA